MHRCRQSVHELKERVLLASHICFQPFIAAKMLVHFQPVGVCFVS